MADPINLPYQNSVLVPTGGTNPLNGQGQDYQFTLSLPSTGGEVTIILTDLLTGVQTQIGFGNATGESPTFSIVFNDKIYFLNGNTVYFSAIDEPTVFNEPTAAGNGFIVLGNQVSAPEPQVSIAPYQGRLAFMARRTVQIWYVDPDPSQNAKQQVLPNIGTVAALSVQAVGDMDIYMLADNGVRSVRVRDASDNAIIADVGTPIDAILQPVLANLTDAQKATACGIVEPSSNRYMLFIPNSSDPDNGVGKIYVFSYFPSSGIAAWSTYSPTYQVNQKPSATVYPNPANVTYGVTIGKRYAWLPGENENNLVCGTTILTQAGSFVATATTVTVTGNATALNFTGLLTETTSFTPEKMVVFNGQVFIRGHEDNLFYQYGGADNNTYENCGVTGVTPYIDNGSPATRKSFESVDAAFSGRWAISASADYISNIFRPIYCNTFSSFQIGRIGYAARGTHYALQMVEDGNGYALLSSAAMHLSGSGNEK